jgi:formylglycine-generating enzyme required for sulfatase activity
MKFLPIANSKLLVCSWETRRKDYDEFVKRSHYTGDVSWRSTTFKQGDSDPVVNIVPADAVAFCKWLTQNERKQGLISSAQGYRLPTDAEWNLVNEAEGALAPGQPFPWGRALNPPVGAGNFAQWCSYDRFSFTAPVGSFQPSRSGVQDLAGNVWEMCRDGSTYVGRGGSWQTEMPEQLQVLFRLPVSMGERKQDVGFRCVLDFAAVD